MIVHFDLPQGPIVSIQVQYVEVVRKAPMKDVLLAAQPTPLASIIKVPADSGKPSGDIAYGDLVCTEEDKLKIGRIITTMGENGKVSLLFKSSELKRLGAEINHVHPLRFLGTIFSNPQLKAYMREVYNDYFKWNGFMDGLAPSLTSHAERGKLDYLLNDFGKEVGVSADSLRGYVHSRDWEGLVRFLMNN